MIVACEQCNTQFKLDDSKVPEGGARVRCSRCKHAFFIHPPGHQDDVQAESLAREALEQARGSTPPAREPDLPPSADDSESDWTFNEDPAAGADADPQDLSAARQAVDDLLAPPAGESLPPAERIELADSGPVPGLEAGLDERLDDQLDDQLDPSPPPEIASPVTSAPTDLEAAVDAAAGEVDLGVGQPDEWDLFGEEDGEGEKQEQAEPRSTPVARVPLVPRWKLEQEAARPPADLEAAIDAEIDPGLGSEPGAVARLIRRAADVTGWCVTVALLGLGVWGVAMAPSSVDAARVDSQDLGPLRAEDVAGHWIENALDGPLYVVSGELRNRDSAPVNVGSLGVRLLDAEGRPLEHEAARLALPLDRPLLREADAATRRAVVERNAPFLAGMRLLPGGSSRFEALIGVLPDAAARYRIEPLGSAAAR